MKLVEILAKELSIWPEGAYAYAQDGNRKTYAWTGIPEFDGEDWLIAENAHIHHGENTVLYPPLADDYKTSVVTKAQWQAERDRQKGGEWKRHRGGKPPVNLNSTVEVKLRCGDIQEAKANAFIWRYEDCDVAANIMQYRVISQPQAEEVGARLFKDVLGTNFPKGTIIHGPLKMGSTVIAPAHPEYKGEDTNMGTLSYKVDIDTSPAIKALNELSAKWDQVESPFKWRDTVNELNAYIEEFTRERDELINRLALEGFALIPAMTAVMGFAPISLPFGEWEPGDFVTSKVDYSKQFTKGKKYKVTGTNMFLGENRVSVESDDKGEANGWLANQFEFHSRP